ncbi:hypothetical protein LCGC14_0714610 [marine sediment metagenome]|uniref:Phage head-tail adaptor n=1 Tax=marine sediment metagenome TaxID=412755 RepID=A0A0F9QZJ5_9ZZZZ
MAIRAGTLRHVVKVESVTVARDDYADPLETWALWPAGSSGFRRASITPTGGSETEIGGARVFVGTFEVRMRYRSGFTAGMRLTFNSRVMHITQVVHVDEINHEIILLCEEVAS